MSGVFEAALQVPAHAAGIVLVDGSQFAPAMETMLRNFAIRPSPPLVRGDVQREE